MSGPSTRDPSSLLEGTTCGALHSALSANVPISQLQIAAISVERWSSFAPQTDDSDARLEKDVEILLAMEEVCMNRIWQNRYRNSSKVQDILLV